MLRGEDALKGAWDVPVMAKKKAKRNKPCRAWLETF
jgi:hypothetical protein